MRCRWAFGRLEDAGKGAGDVGGLKPRFDSDGMAMGMVQMSDLTEEMGTDRGEGRTLRRPRYEDGASGGCMTLSLTCTIDGGK